MLIKRIKVWRVAQAVYMPQTSVYLSEEPDSPTSDDALSLDHSKPETWPLFLPSSIPSDKRSLCYKGVVEFERALRLAQLQDDLVELRSSRRALRNLRLYFKTNLAGEGQKTQTRSRTIETSAKNRINRAVRRYRTAYNALLGLDATGDWANEYRKLRDEDNRGPLKEAEETGVGDGRYAPSWIWVTPSAMPLPCEGSAAEQREVNETARFEWTTCRARADRWKEEEELLQEEMRRVAVYLEWKSNSWSERVGARVDSCTPDIQHGVDAYARKQAHIHRELAISFASQWLPFLKSCGYETKWTEDLPWVSQALSRNTKLPKWFPSVPADTPPAPPPTGSTKRRGMAQDIPTTKSKDCSHKEREHGENSNGDDRGLSDEEGGSDDEYEASDGDSDGQGPNEQGCDDSADPNDEPNFEYDDEYMS